MPFKCLLYGNDRAIIYQIAPFVKCGAKKRQKFLKIFIGLMPAQGRNNVVIPYREGTCRSGLPSYELICSNVISDERGEPRVMSCLAAT